MENPQEQVSKLISYWLRHNPQEADLEVDDFGWVSIKQLLIALERNKYTLTFNDLTQLNNSFDKTRWEIDTTTDRIRATHGHSFPVVLGDKSKLPPEVLYHGTSVKFISQIAVTGLLNMKRTFVHLSETIGAAISVGKRHGKHLIIEISTERLVKEGWIFYKTSDNVWLTNEIPPDYLHFQPWFRVRNTENHSVNELRREIGNRKSHFIYPQLDDLKLTWNTGASDDKLFQNQKTRECYMIHLTYTKRKQEIDGYPHIEEYKSEEEWIEKGLWNDQQYFYDLK
jgi:RNA:NAD 2'-phosphotransferase (TPT1/KptA family)